MHEIVENIHTIDMVIPDRSATVLTTSVSLTSHPFAVSESQSEGQSVTESGVNIERAFEGEAPTPMKRT
jgi:hypothetical protein